MPRMRVEVVVGDEAAQAAYEAFVAHNANPIAWDRLRNDTKDAWRHVAANVVAHISAKDSRP